MPSELCKQSGVVRLVRLVHWRLGESRALFVRVPAGTLPLDERPCVRLPNSTDGWPLRKYVLRRIRGSQCCAAAGTLLRRLRAGRAASETAFATGSPEVDALGGVRQRSSDERRTPSASLSPFIPLRWTTITLARTKRISEAAGTIRMSIAGSLVVIGSLRS